MFHDLLVFECCPESFKAFREGLFGEFWRTLGDDPADAVQQLVRVLLEEVKETIKSLFHPIRIVPGVAFLDEEKKACRMIVIHSCKHGVGRQFLLKGGPLLEFRREAEAGYIN